MEQVKKLPELLSPAGSPEALRAAVAAGADAVYFGGADFSNRMRAKNFSLPEIGEAIAFCHGYGVKCYITVNTRVRDLELPAVLSFCRSLAEAGADGLIVADLGIAAAAAKELLPHHPALELHASTQMSLATPKDGEVLRTLGFSRMVVPRELHERDLRRVCADSSLEIEMFIHGAHCVSYSGQCLMSWAMGGRSGNRGECAQPCRMTYRVTGAGGDGKTVRSRYPLSLKDMCLANHIPAIIDAGVASLKIEGRQKSAAYVYGVTSVYRRLLDERRCATEEEMGYLDALFSRDGFTDGYFTGKRGHMLGVRPEDAGSAAATERYDFDGRRRRLTGAFTLRSGAPAVFTLQLGDVTVSAEGEIPEKATGAAMTEDAAAKNLTKFGGTPFRLAGEDIRFSVEEGLYYPVSGLNAIRRACLARLTEALEKKEPVARDVSGYRLPERTPVTGERTCEVLFAVQVTEEMREYFHRIYLPWRQYGIAAEQGVRDGAELCGILPPVVYDDGETARILARLREKGCGRVMVHTTGQLALAKAAGLTVDGSFRLNLTNSEALETWYGLGLTMATVSPELKLPAIRDLRYPAAVTVYGRVPLMVTERCFVSDGGCGAKGQTCAAALVDRMGEAFPVFSDGSCRSVIYNSRKLRMGDRLREVKNASALHFMFTDETAAEIDGVIDEYRRGRSVAGGKRL